MKYLEPINLHDYLQAKGPSKAELAEPGKFESTALQLTTHLLRKQSNESPVSLNTLVSAWLIQEEDSKLKMSTLLTRAGMIYDYLKSKPWVKTYMNVRPMKGLVESNITGLGLKMQSLNKKDKMILLGPIKNEWRTNLILAYYNMNLMPVFLLEGCLCTFLKSSSSGPISEPIELSHLFKILSSYADLFKNEHMTSNDESEEIFHQRINYFAERGLIQVSPDRKTCKIEN